MAQVRVMLVDDSPLFVASMKAVIDKVAGLSVAGTASNGQEALNMVSAVRPDVIVCDVQMPQMTGIEFLKALLPKHKIPVVVISGTPGVTLSALANGAVDFIPKPAASEPSDAFFKRMLTAIQVAAQANVGAKMAQSNPREQAARANLGNTVGRAPLDAVVAIGASTGGTEAIATVVESLPPDCPPVVITQHMPAGFTAMYAQRLNRECKMQVKEARDGDRLKTGLIILAAGDNHLRLAKDTQGYFVTSKNGIRVNGHVPSVDVLFESVADVAASRAVGVILTGMGGDGAEGLLKMRKAGALTIGQDQATSVVYGMPMMAFNKGAVMKQLPLGSIAEQIVMNLNTMR